MSVEVLVMCPSCGRPQPARQSCAHCGATLPSSPVPVRPETEGAAPAGAGGPLFGQTEFDLGHGRRLRVDAEAVELVGVVGPAGDTLVRPVAGLLGASPARLPFNTLRRVALERRRAWAALAVVGAGMVLSAVSMSWPVRIAGLLVAAVGLWLFLRIRTWVVRFERTTGGDARLVLGGSGLAASSAPVAERAWAGLSEALRLRGVAVGSAEPARR